VLAGGAAAQNAPRPRATPTPTPAPKGVIVTPAPTPAPTVTPTPVPVQTLTDLQARIKARTLRPELRRGQVGIKIASLNTGKVIYEENAEKYFMPASNMKNFTVATALEKLTPDFRFVTSVYAAAPPDASGTVKGDLRIMGRGDVSISTAFNEGDYFKGIDALADRIVAAGVKRVEGALIGDETYFQGNAIPGSWEWDDLQWYYGAEISALPLNDNAVDLAIQPGVVGYPCAVKLSPSNAVIQIVNQCTTTAPGTQRTLRIEKKLDRNIIEITGSLPAGNSGFKGSVTVTHPSELFMALLRQRLAEKGVTVTGQTRFIKTRTQTPPAESVEIAKLESPPLSLIAAKTMKPSQNMYTETLLWTLGEEARKASMTDTPGGGTANNIPAEDSADLGRAVVKRFLTGIGIPEDAVLQTDGSGLSRHNLVTPSSVVQLYTYMVKNSRFSQAWMDSLTIGGVDGTLRNRFTGTRAAANVRGKTGTINQVSALSGYVTTAAGERLVFSFIVNGVSQTSDRTSMMDDIIVDLANFNGRID
jgi:D-alanyl-D-alanine carboxypeptidase/D-alanyl-D-alanine-endopeptidase (penicillin-binding protein 4)